MKNIIILTSTNDSTEDFFRIENSHSDALDLYNALKEEGIGSDIIIDEIGKKFPSNYNNQGEFKDLGKIVIYHPTKKAEDNKLRIKELVKNNNDVIVYNLNSAMGTEEEILNLGAKGVINDKEHFKTALNNEEGTIFAVLRNLGYAREENYQG